MNFVAEQDNTWVLNKRDAVYLFELPNEIYSNWEHSAAKQRRDALRIKRDYFSKIVLFNKPDGKKENITVLRLSERFMNEAEQSLVEDEI